MRSPQFQLTYLSSLLLALIAVLVEVGCDSSKSQPASGQPSKINSTTDAMTAGDGGNRTSDVSTLNPEFDWKQFRGPQGESIQNSSGLPLEWSDEEGIAWKAELPGRGSSSPIVVGNRVFVTAYSGYGISPTERGAPGHLRYHLICKDRDSGKTLWQRNIRGSMLTQRLNDTLLGHGFASNSPVTDGEMVYVFHNATGVFAFDMEGELKWQQNLGVQFYFFGSSASPVIYEDKLIVNASIENKTIYALDKKTGKGIWRIEGIDRCYSLPVFGKAPDGSTEMVIVEEDMVHGYDPQTGEELWHCEGIHNYIIAVPVIRDGIVYCNGGLDRQTLAIKLGGRGDVTDTHKVWEVPHGGNVGSPVVYQNVLFVADDNGIMGSYDLETGERLERQRTKTKTRIYASPLLVENRIYVPLQDEGVVVMEADPKMKELARNRISSDPSPIHGSIAPNGDRMFLRTDNFLYCIAQHDGPPEVIQQDPQLNQSNLIDPEPRVDFDPNTNRLKPYCYYLAKDENGVIQLVLSPYKSVITEEQTIKSKELILADYEKFDELRQRHDDAYWEYIQGKLTREQLLEKLAPIEQETLAHSGKVRIPVKKLFSKEQMDQHLKEAAEWQRKQKEKAAAQAK